MTPKRWISTLATLLLAASAWAADAPTTAPSTPPGKLAPKPLYRDPVYNNPTDPVITYNAETKRWLMYYTQRRGGSVALIHGSKIGIAASEDGGATWKYIGTADITYGQDQHPADYTYWAPEVIWAKGQYHMYLAFVPGIFNDWNHPREIGHLTSTDGIKWTTVGKVDLGSEKVIDPCVIQLPAKPDGSPGDWRMFYKDEAAKSHHIVSYADSPDLYHWQTQGPAVTDRNGEGEKCIHWQGKYWLMADTDRPEGQAVWVSDDCTHWTPQDTTIFGSHGDIVVNGDRAWWFYFGGQRPGNQHWAVLPRNTTATPASLPAPEPATQPATQPATEPGAPRRRGGGGIAINVVELKVVDGKLMYTDPSDPVYVDLGDHREAEN